MRTSCGKMLLPFVLIFILTGGGVFAQNTTEIDQANQRRTNMMLTMKKTVIIKITISYGHNHNHIDNFAFKRPDKEKMLQWFTLAGY